LFAQSDDVLVPHALKEAATAKVTVQTLRRNISVLYGAGGNIAVLTGPTEKLLVDAEIVSARPNVFAALTSIMPTPSRIDQTLTGTSITPAGMSGLHEAGAGHSGPRKHAQAPFERHARRSWNHTFPAAPAGAIPSTVFKEDHTLQVNGATLILKHYMPAHTDSDISVHFTEADIFHTGDTFWNRNYPFIDYSTGGSIEGTIRAAEANLARVTTR